MLMMVMVMVVQDPTCTPHHNTIESLFGHVFKDDGSRRQTPDINSHSFVVTCLDPEFHVVSQIQELKVLTFRGMEEHFCHNI